MFEFTFKNKFNVLCYQGHLANPVVTVSKLIGTIVDVDHMIPNKKTISGNMDSSCIQSIDIIVDCIETSSTKEMIPKAGTIPSKQNPNKMS